MTNIRHTYTCGIVLGTKPEKILWISGYFDVGPGQTITLRRTVTIPNIPGTWPVYVDVADVTTKTYLGYYPGEAMTIT